MEHIRMRDNGSSPHPTENSATPLIQADPSLLSPNRREFDAEYPAWSSPSSSTTSSRFSDKSRFSRFEPPRLKPLFRGFERPSFFRIAILSAICPTTYPAFYLLTLVAKDRSLFIVRLMVSIWCSGIGFALGYILLRIGAQHLEAATWATVIHESHQGGGMKLRDLDRSSRNPKSFMPAFHLFLSRFGSRETSRHSRKSYDKRPWSLFLGFFIVLAILGPLLPFLFGRIIEINTFLHNQRGVYREVLIAGDLSQEDLNATSNLWGRAGVYRIWPTFPYGGRTSGIAELVYRNEIVYFAQPSLSQFVTGGSGAYSDVRSGSADLKDGLNNTVGLTGRNASKSGPGVVLRYPQWGIRIHCEKLPDPKVNLIPRSSQNLTYAFIPRDFLRGLFGVYGMDLPTKFMEPDLSSQLYQNDTIPSNIDPSTISSIRQWDDNNMCIGLDYDEQDSDDQGWMAVETVLIRVNTRFARSGRFPVYSQKPNVGEVGFDAAVCALKYESWIVEAYNASTGSPSTLRIVEKGSGGFPSGSIRGAPITNTRYLNGTGKGWVFISAQGNSIYQIVNDDGPEEYYPSPTAVSFTDGDGPGGYTELSADRLAIARARIGAINTLPYLVGSGPVVAQSYQDETLAFTTYKRWQLIGLPILLWILGVIGELFVPVLPFNIPRREFGVYSWLELRFEAADDLDKFMSLDEVEEKISDKRVKFIV